METKAIKSQIDSVLKADAAVWNLSWIDIWVLDWYLD